MRAAKTDPKDALVLADYARRNAKTYPKPPKERLDNMTGTPP